MWNVQSIRKRSFMQRTILSIVLLLLLGAVFVSVQALTLISETTWGGVNAEVSEGAAVASDGSTYVVGTTHTFGNNPPNIFLLKFAADDTLAWQRTWEGPGFFGIDEARNVAVAPDDSVYVTGFTLGSAVLLKFAPDGSLVWQRSWDGGATERGEAVAVASDGSVYVTGSTSSFGAGENDIFALKFTSAGALVWQKTWGTSASDDGQGVAVASDGSVYVAGVTPRPNTFEFDVVLLKLHPDGNLVWQKMYSAGTGTDARGGVTVAPGGSVYVAGGFFDRNSDLDALLIKVAPDGSLVWDRSWGGRSGDEAIDVIVAADETVFLAGNTNSFAVGSDDAFIVQFQPTGKATTAVTWGGAGLEHGDGVAIAADGTISLAGTAEAPPYSFLEAPKKTTRLRGTLATPAIPLVDAVGTIADPAGVVGTPNGSLTFAGDFDAALVRITP